MTAMRNQVNRAGAMFRGLLAVAACSVAMACTVPAPQQAYPPLSFAHLAPIRIDVAEVEVVDNYRPPLAAPNVEHAFPITPAAALMRWAADRLVAAGETRTARLVIEDASVRAEPLPVREGLTGLFYKEQEVRYEGTLRAVLEVRTERGYRDSFATANVVRARTAPEAMTLNERERLFVEIVQDLVTVMNQEFEAQIRRHMAQDLR
jgi:hypothetical protein